MKTKTCRMWFIKTALPLPYKDAASMESKTAAKVLAGGIARHIAGPVAGLAVGVLTDMIDEFKEKFAKLPYKVESPGRKPYYNQKQKEWAFLKSGVEGYHKEGETPEIGWAWVNIPQNATSYETREAAETEAFNFIAICPWFMNRLDIVKVKLGKGEP